MTQDPNAARITRDDLKSKLDDMQGDALEQVDGVKNQMLAVADSHFTIKSVGPR